MENKICPLFWASSEIPDYACECKAARCAWYVPPIYRGSEARCAVQALGSLPVLTSEVAKL